MDEYIEWVLNRLPKFDNEADASSIRECIIQRYQYGYTKEDALAFCKLTEEVNPELEEKLALARMNKLSAKYWRGKYR